MAELYAPDVTPEQYDPQFLSRELERIAIALQELEPPWVILPPQYGEPGKVKEGMVVNADGTSWNPGAGAGLYEYIGGVWNKL